MQLQFIRKGERYSGMTYTGRVGTSESYHQKVAEEDMLILRTLSGVFEVPIIAVREAQKTGLPVDIDQTTVIG